MRTRFPGRDERRGRVHAAGTGANDDDVDRVAHVPARMRTSARLSILKFGVTGSSGSSVSPSGRLKLASSAPTNARSSASVGGSSAARGLHERPADLAEPVVRHADDRRARDLRVAGQHVFHFRRIHVVAAANEHLALAAAEVEVTLRVEPTQVARVDPALGVDRLRGRLGFRQ
jgi:hypothetical protein